jgi:hypothetical protein
MGTHAASEKHRVGELASLPDDAALATETVSQVKLARWIKGTALPRLEQVLPVETYRELASGLRPDQGENDRLA